MSNYFETILPSEEATLEIAGRLGRALGGGELVFLEGELGAGKTTFSRGILRARGHEGAVKSPTFTLVEPYDLGPSGEVFHFDLYRLGDPDELEYIGIDDYLDRCQLILVEWPERGASRLPASDLTIKLAVMDDARRLRIEANSERGVEIVRQLETSAEKS